MAVLAERQRDDARHLLEITSAMHFAHAPLAPLKHPGEARRALARWRDSLKAIVDAPPTV